MARALDVINKIAKNCTYETDGKMVFSITDLRFLCLKMDNLNADARYDIAEYMRIMRRIKYAYHYTGRKGI